MTEQERIEKYNCDGRCYGSGMCPRADTCPETRMGKLLTMLGSIVVLFFVPVLVFIVIILVIVWCL